MRERVRRGLRAAAVTLVAGLLLPGGAVAQEQQGGSKVRKTAAAGFDAVLMRPLGLATLALGAMLFVPVACLTAPGGKHSLKEASEVFVTGPAEHVFKRPLGEF